VYTEPDPVVRNGNTVVRGGAIPNATVRLLSQEMGVTHTETSGTNWSFRFIELSPGTYNLTPN